MKLILKKVGELTHMDAEGTPEEIAEYARLTTPLEIPKPLSEVWLVSSLLPDQSKDAWEVNGVHTTLESALAACTDGQSAAVHMVLNEDYRGKYEFWQATPDRPEPFLTDGHATQAP